MRHLPYQWFPNRFTSSLPASPRNERDTRGPRWRTDQGLQPSWEKMAVFLTVALTISVTITSSFTATSLATEAPVSEPPRSPEAQAVLPHIRTILVTGCVQTWLDVPAPPYDVEVTLKLKLQDAGFHVIFDANEPHDATLLIQYEEIPSGRFQVLEQATAIRYRMRLIHDQLGELFSHSFEAQPSTMPIGSLYWDAIGNLEEDPYYCFVGDLIHGQLHRGRNKQDMLLEVLVRPFTQQNLVNPAGSRGANQEAILHSARLNIIQELGQGLFDTPEAQNALWTVAKTAEPNERGAALAQLGKIGDRSFIPPLTHLLEKEDNPEVRSAVEQAIQRLESR
jgi:hypothetical protein